MRLRGEHGMATVELALALPVLVLVTWAATAAVMMAQMRVRCADAAREAALAVSRGDADHAVALAEAAAGRSVELFTVPQADGSIVVTVRLLTHPLGWLGALSVDESAVVARQPAGTS